MQVFYAPDIDGAVHILDEKESRHIVKVLRMKKGMPVNLIDGKGTLYEGEIQDDNLKRCIIKITSSVRNFESRNYNLHIAISPLKNTDRFEWFVEKSVELGIDSITPLICHNTEKQSIKLERINGIIVAAMKQSLKAKITTLHRPVDFREFIKNKPGDIRMIAHCNNSFSRINLKNIYIKGENATILIGPEGDFTAEEIVLASGSGYEGVSLGAGRLRTETAGVAACHSVHFMNQ
jgi:16S rRNA (uracil1498-N3)-methyltransferase